MFTLGLAGATGPVACDFEVSKPAARFLRTLQTGVNEGTIPLAHLQWMIQQPLPSNPVLTPRRPENLEIKRSLGREIPAITESEWKLIVEKALALEQQITVGREQTREAVDTTKNIYALAPIGFKFPREETFIQSHTTSTGEPFMVTQDEHGFHIYNFATGNKISLREKTFNDKPHFDFFERSNGDILFALNSETSLTVLDLRSGKTIFKQSLPQDHTHSPLIYEDDGVLSIALGDRWAQDIQENSAQLAYVRIQPQPGAETFTRTRFAPSRLVRLHDGHLYQFISTGNHTKNEMNFRIFDVSADKEVLLLEKVPGQASQYERALIFDTTPRILMQKSIGPWSLLDPKTRELKPLGLQGLSPHIRALFNHGGQVLRARFSGLDTQQPKLLVDNILTGEKKWIDVGYDGTNRVDTNHDSTGLLTKMGTFVHVWELDQNQIRAKLHLYNLDSEELQSFTMPAGLDVRDPVELIYNATDGRILMIVKPVDRPWEIFQIYGPERHQR